MAYQNPNPRTIEQLMSILDKNKFMMPDDKKKPTESELAKRNIAIAERMGGGYED